MGLQRRTDTWSAGIVENSTTVGLIQLHAAYAGRLAVGHAGDQRTDGGRRATGATVSAALHVRGVRRCSSEDDRFGFLDEAALNRLHSEGKQDGHGIGVLHALSDGAGAYEVGLLDE